MPVLPAITAIGGYVPDDVLCNEEFEKLLKLDNEWIVKRTGVKERRILKGEQQGTSVMAIKAVEELCAKRQIGAHEIDAIICATVTPDMLFPCTANLVGHAIGATHALSFDMLAACSGFIYALETGSNYIRSGRYSKVVVIGADKMSSRIDQHDRDSSFLFGDGAGAVLLEPNSEGYGIIDAILRTDGSGAHLLNLKMGGSAYPMTTTNLDRGYQYFYQDGKTVFKHAVARMVSVTREILNHNKLGIEDVNCLIPHQSNRRIIEIVAKELQFPLNRVLINIEKYGNTTAATIPLCLWEYEKTFNRGDKIILTAFGGGFTWGSVLITWAI